MTNSTSTEKVQNMYRISKQQGSLMTIKALLKEFDEFVHQSTLDGISIEEVYEMIKEWITKAYHQGELNKEKEMLSSLYDNRKKILKYLLEWKDEDENSLKHIKNFIKWSRLKEIK
ncbi:MAG: terminase large subunit [archaeon]